MKPYCSKCKTEMQYGIAMEQTFVGGMPDFAGDDYSSTFSAGGSGKLIECWKCRDCGYSVYSHIKTEQET